MGFHSTKANPFSVGSKRRERVAPRHCCIHRYLTETTQRGKTYLGSQYQRVWSFTVGKEKQRKEVHSLMEVECKCVIEVVHIIAGQGGDIQAGTKDPT